MRSLDLQLWASNRLKNCFASNSAHQHMIKCRSSLKCWNSIDSNIMKQLLQPSPCCWIFLPTLIKSIMSGGPKANARAHGTKKMESNTKRFKLDEIISFEEIISWLTDPLDIRIKFSVTVKISFIWYSKTKATPYGIQTPQMHVTEANAQVMKYKENNINIY